MSAVGAGSDVIADTPATKEIESRHELLPQAGDLVYEKI
jgi:hypothetical protein